MFKGIFYSFISIGSTLLGMLGIMYFGYGPGHTYIKKMTAEHKSVCEVNMPQDTVIYDNGCEDNDKCLTSKTKNLWVMNHMNVPYQRYLHTVVLESGSALMQNHGIVYAKEGSIVGGVSGSASGARNKIVFYEEGAKIYNARGMTLVKCGEILISKDKPKNINIPKKRDVDLLFYEKELGKNLRFSPDTSTGKPLGFTRSSSSICLERIHLDVKGIVPHSMLFRPTYMVEVTLARENVYEKSIIFWITELRGLSVSIGSNSRDQSIGEFTEHLRTRMIRSFCFKDLPGPGTYDLTIRLDVGNRIEESNEENNIFQSSLELN